MGTSNQIAKLQTPDRNLNAIQDQLRKVLNPILSNPIVNGLVLTQVSLSSGANSIDHKLGRNLTGWMIVRQRGSAAFYDTQDSNPLPDKTLSLVSSAAVVVDLYVF